MIHISFILHVDEAKCYTGILFEINKYINCSGSGSGRFVGAKCLQTASLSTPTF